MERKYEHIRREELLEEIVFRLLEARYPPEKFSLGRYVSFAQEGSTTKRSFDFLIKGPNEYQLIEVKSGRNQQIIGLWAKLFSATAQSLKLDRPVTLYLYTDNEFYKKTLDIFSKQHPRLQIISGSELLRQINSNLGIRLEGFSSEELRAAIQKLDAQRERFKSGGSAGAGIPPEIKDNQNSFLTPPGKSRQVVVLSADYCSYSRFVKASAGETELVIREMSRFYGQSREIIGKYGGYLDKFIGDGILAFWTVPDKAEILAPLIKDCAEELRNLALSIAQDWQTYIDDDIRPVGLRTGIAIGEILLIDEIDLSGTPHWHAIGDCINLSARLMKIAKPSQIVISNQLKAAVFASNSDFLGPETKRLKSFGPTRLWRLP